ncbi:MAG: bifunctional riboflavin kinase/FAD synthetase [Bacilli bacterium]|nr:bifunctional riboflavin kinase/FAD synthetase [Bacilli bacterium]
MKIIEFDLNNVPKEYPNLALCLGFFDGVHLGHQSLINRALKTKKEVGVLTFSTPPAYVIGRKDTKRSLTSIDDKADILEAMGVSYLFVMPFDQEIMNVSRLDFINNVLKVMNPLEIFCGEDYRFGKDALGTPKFLSHYFKVTVVELKKFKDNKFSSKSIRKLIYEGDIKTANKVLGHPYRIGGFVASGNHKGQTLGFPTANIDLDFAYVIPSNGVYMGYTYLHEEKYKCLISVGTHPTLGELDAPIIEVYIMDFDGVIYGDLIFVEFIDRIRDMFKFNDPSELVEQIKKDKEVALKYL